VTSTADANDGEDDRMPMLEGKVAVVTGAGRGIGRGIANEFAREGAKVAVTSLSAENARKVAAEITDAGGDALPLACNVNEKEAIDRMVATVLDHWGVIDVLANNAQGSMGTDAGSGGPIETMTADQMYANYLGGPLATLWAMQAVFPTMKGRGGRIINTSSLNGQVGRTFTGAYNAAKEGVRALTRTAAREWAQYGITVNVVSPTILSDSVNAGLEQNPKFLDMLESGTPLRRVGIPAEAGRVVVFLASDDAAYITGATFMLDKGRIMHADARQLRYPDERHEVVGTMQDKWY
jgi:NAD(P)-dependent dehydrogenase (short-subunit alcohol dehydrogenase family)